MRTIIRILAALAFMVAVQPSAAVASVTRVAGPSQLFHEPAAFVKFDVAFDEVNRRYLVVWGVQGGAPIPTKGLFLNEAGQPIGAPFPISDGAIQAGWARVVYSAQEDRFLVSYTKILPNKRYQRAARFVTSAAGVVGGEIVLADWVGHSASESGLAYSAAARKWLVTWWIWTSPYPTSYVGVIDGATGAYVAQSPVSNPADGQSDPEIACDPSGRCLVVGYAWSLPLGGKVNSTWGRFVNASTGAPDGAPFYVDSYPIEGNPSVLFNSASNQYIVALDRDMRSVWASTVSLAGAIGGPFLVKGADAACSGYGGTAMAHNPATGTVLFGMIDWCDTGTVQETNAQAAPIAGAFDRIPGAGTKAIMVAADGGARRYLVADNQGFYVGRSSIFATDGTSLPAPAQTSNPAMTIDIPGPGVVNHPFLLAGWAIDRGSAAGTGVDTVHVWAWPADGSAPRFVGVANYGWSRPDVGAAFGSRFTNSGYGIIVSGLPGGAYQIAAYSHSTVTGTFNLSRAVSVTIGEPMMSVDAPGVNATVPASGFLVGGWAIDRAASTGTGVDTLHVWAIPTNGGSAIFAGVAPYGGARPDVAAAYGAQYLYSGYNLVVNNLPGGATYDLIVFSHSAVTRTFSTARVVRITVQ